MVLINQLKITTIASCVYSVFWRDTASGCSQQTLVVVIVSEIYIIPTPPKMSHGCCAAEVMDGCRHFCLRSASLICTLGLLFILHDKAPRVVLGGPMEVLCRTVQRLLPWSLHLLGPARTGAGCIHPQNTNSDGEFVFVT